MTDGGPASGSVPPGRQQAIVNAGVAEAGGQVGTPSLLITTHLWIQWAHVALENCQRASKHRRSSADAAAGSESLLQETSSSMVAICAAVFAIEAFVSAAARIVMPPQTVQKWENIGGRSAKAESRVREVLKASIRESSVANTLADQWSTHFERRHNAVHFFENASPPVPHPIGTNTSPEDEMYRSENARAAAALLLDTITAILNSPRPAIASWIADYAATLELLAKKRPS